MANTLSQKFITTIKQITMTQQQAFTALATTDFGMAVIKLIGEKSLKVIHEQTWKEAYEIGYMEGVNKCFTYVNDKLAFSNSDQIPTVLVEQNGQFMNEIKID